MNSAIAYLTPKDMLAERQQEIQIDGMGNWKRRENTGRIAAASRVIDETDNFRVPIIHQRPIQIV